MNIKIEAGLGSISAGVSRIEGLYSKWAQKHGVPYGIVQVFYILRLNGAVTQKQISEICEIPKQTVNSVIKQLKADNHITLIANKEDKREKKIQLTPLGEAYSMELLKHFFELNETVGKRVGINLINQLSNGIKTLGDALEMEMELKEVSSKWEEKIKNNEKKRR
jgi:DNA-binding MarR family transcriptional regulator